MLAECTVLTMVKNFEQLNVGYQNAVFLNWRKTYRNELVLVCKCELDRKWL